MAMGGLLIAVMSYLFIDESRRGDPVLFRPAPLINAYLALLKTSGVMFHGLTSGLAVGMFFAMGGAMPYAFDRMGIGSLEYGLFFALTSIGYILGNFINGLLVGQVGVARMAYLGSLLTALVPMLMLAGDLTGLLTTLLLCFLCFCFGVCSGLVIANASAPPDAIALQVPAFWGQCKCCLAGSWEAQSLRLAVPIILA